MKNYKRALRRHQKETVYKRRIKKIVRKWFPFFSESKYWYEFKDVYPEMAHRLKNHSSLFHRADNWEKTYKVMLKNRKTKYPIDRQKDDEREIYVQQTWFEEFCGTCDNFPGDGCVPPNDDSNPPRCPFAKQFAEHKLTAESEWKIFGCTQFWD